MQATVVRLSIANEEALQRLLASDPPLFDRHAMLREEGLECISKPLEVLNAALAPLRTLGEEPNHGDALGCRTEVNPVPVGKKRWAERGPKPLGPSDRVR
jgi:hypothetical protein